MGIETYLLILGCYALGCYLSYKLGRKHQIRESIKWTVHLCADHLGVSPDKLTCDLAAHAQKHGDKSKEAFKS